MYSLDKYRYTIDYKNGIVLAESTYMGKPVVSKAKTAPEDDFDPNIGMELAAARCNKKIAEKRRMRALKKATEAADAVEKAYAHYHDMMKYYDDSLKHIIEAGTAEEKILKSYHLI